jgi:hypothetical protein
MHRVGGLDGVRKVEKVCPKCDLMKDDRWWSGGRRNCKAWYYSTYRVVQLVLDSRVLVHVIDTERFLYVPIVHLWRVALNSHSHNKCAF